MNKRGQVTIFVILGMIVLISGLIIYSLVSGPKVITNPSESPKTFIKNCIEDDFLILIENISAQGGSMNPEFYHHYYGNNIQILCTTSTYYDTCTIQKPLLQESIEKELKESIEEKLNSCFDELEDTLVGKGYSVELNRDNFEVKLNPNRISLEINNTLTISKEEEKRFEDFDFSFEHNLYSLIQITKSIIEWESLVGDIDVIELMENYRDYEITKDRAANDYKVYKITDRNTKDYFQFVTKSMVYPPGYT